MADEIAEVAAEGLLGLRWRVLRIGRPPESARMVGDDDATTRHFALLRDGEPRACVSLMAAPFPDADDGPRWQLRGMAVDNELQGQGVGSRLIQAIQALIAEPMWCNSRTHAVGFYGRHGWRVTSDVFDVPKVGPHKRMTWTPTDALRSLARGTYLELVADGRWEFVRRVNSTGVVAIAAATAAGEIVLVEQHRPPVGGPVMELPAGLAGDIPGEEDEALERAAARELEEETGFVAERLERIFDGPSSAGLSNERITLFLARNVVRTGAGGGDASEDIVVHVVPMAGIDAFLAAAVARGVAIDWKLPAGLWFLRNG